MASWNTNKYPQQDYNIQETHLPFRSTQEFFSDVPECKSPIDSSKARRLGPIPDLNDCYMSIADRRYASYAQMQPQQSTQKPASGPQSSSRKPSSSQSASTAPQGKANRRARSIQVKP